MKNNDLVNIRETLYHEIKSNKEVMRILNDAGVSDEVIKRNLTFIHDYIDAKKSVAVCKKHKKCINHNRYHDAELIIDEQIIATTPVICPVYYAKQQLISRFIFKDYPDGSDEVSIGHLTPRAAFNAFRTEMVLFIEHKRDMVYVCAPFNSGIINEATAFLMQALANEKEATVGMVDLAKLVREFPSDLYKHKDVINEYIDKIRQIDYLVIHGLGNEETNTMIRETIVFPLIKGRADAKKRTAYFSEFSLAELSRLYDPRKNDMRVKQIITLIERTIEREVFINAAAI